MVRIAIVDDEQAAREKMRSAILRFASENGNEFDVDEYTCAGDYLTNKRGNYDILFLDIDMPGVSGMELAEDIRLTDQNTLIIFCTNLAQFAVNGYEVSALGFLVKPVEWYPLCLYMHRALNLLATRERMRGRGGKKIIVKNGSSARMVDVSTLVYIEVRKHKLLFFVRDKMSGEEPVFESRGSMRAVSAELSPYGFARCASSFLVNLSMVTLVDGLGVHLGKQVVPIGRTFKDDFKRHLARYLATKDWEVPQQ